jgi:signal transduction histidine kinase/CheY-like chemotaxis protein/HAMP domain-containing protein
VANGDLKRKLTVDAKGEIADLADTINGMIDTLATFADQVTNMAREVGIEGQLGGQARVPGAAGLWRDLTDNVNQLAENLTNQVRSIANVATAVTKGDLSRSIAVQASGEMAALKDNINEMIRNLKEQTLKNAEQDWLKTNLARFSRMLQGERDLKTVSTLIMSELAPLVNAQFGVFYVTGGDEGEPYLELAASYGVENRSELRQRFGFGEGLIGQCAADRRVILIEQTPSEFMSIASGLGRGAPANVIILPALFEGDVKAVLELASFSSFNETHQSFLDQLMESVGIVLNTLAATMRTEGLLKQSQLLTTELQARQLELTRKQEELHATNEELQEKAEQLALTSKYKSEFLANMSHELRTPLNSLLILSKLLQDNQQGNLDEKQVEFARTINAAGTDLLSLINDILDLSKVESGTVTIEIDEMPLSSLKLHMERTFGQIAADKGLQFKVNVDDDLPPAIRTDEKRLQQIMLNLLSNAFKFTSAGSVTLNIRKVTRGWSGAARDLKPNKPALAISVTDTGIGIPRNKQKLIFEAFQQADGTTSRKYGGTGLGLSISREIARLLGGELQVKSEVGEGSTFTLYMPLEPVSTGVAQPVQPSEGTAPAKAAARAGAPVEVSDDRDAIAADDFVVMIVEDDAIFARILLDVARAAGFKGVVATAGAGTLALARSVRPDVITLDLGLADIDGLLLLDLLKHDGRTRHVPVHVISGGSEGRSALELGAASVTLKPANHGALSQVFRDLHELAQKQRPQTLVLARGDEQGQRLAAAASKVTRSVRTVSSVDEAVASGPEQFNAVIVELPRAAKERLRLLAQIAGAEALVQRPLLLQSAKSDVLRQSADRLKDAPSVDLVLDETELADRLSRIIDPVRLENAGTAFNQSADLSGARVLIIDDDIRNIFSMTSVLESFGMSVLHAEGGREGLSILRKTPEIDIALVDIMMPEMDGYETIGAIRKLPAHADIPIIAVTAKAMKGDRQKCIEAGASEYIAKPVDMDLLLALLRVWVSRARDREGRMLTQKAAAE